MDLAVNENFTYVLQKSAKAVWPLGGFSPLPQCLHLAAYKPIAATSTWHLTYLLWHTRGLWCYKDSSGAGPKILGWDPRNNQKYTQDNPQWDREVHGATAVLECLLESWEQAPRAEDHMLRLELHWSYCHYAFHSIPSRSYTEDTPHRMLPAEANGEEYEDIYNNYGYPMEYDAWGQPLEEYGYDWYGTPLVWNDYGSYWTFDQETEGLYKLTSLFETHPTHRWTLVGLAV
ncbi:hypothetical protein EDB89DRAFT_1910619 [Lactarius sanguifluus]|nr:hypothetical protein EDB89DRAFT_1910619 [Lactarius sanguifluus]